MTQHTDRTIRDASIGARITHSAPGVWLLSSHLNTSQRAADDAELTLSDNEARALANHFMVLGLPVEELDRAGLLSCITVTGPTGAVINISREWDVDAERARMRAATAADMGDGPTLSELELMADVREISDERHDALRQLAEAQTEVRQLRTALADANVRAGALNDRIAELRAARPVPAGPDVLALAA